MRTDAPRPRRKASNAVSSRRASRRRSPKKRSRSGARPCRRRRTDGSQGSAPWDSFVSSFPTPSTSSSSVTSAPPIGARSPRPPACRTPKVGRCWTPRRRCAASWRMSLPGRPAFCAAVSAGPGPRVEAAGAPDGQGALRAVEGADRETTAVFAVDSPRPEAGSLYEHVHVRVGYEVIARRLLGGVVVGREVTREGVFRASGMLRAGADPRTALDARKAELQEEIRTHEHGAADASDATRGVESAYARLARLRSDAAAAPRPDEWARMLDATRGGEREAESRLADLERAAGAAEERAGELGRQLDAQLREGAQQRAVLEQRQLERARWHDRVDSLRRQHSLVDEDVARLTAGSEERLRHLHEAEHAAVGAVEALPELRVTADRARQAHAAAEQDAPEDEAGMAESAKQLVAIEEARIDARLRTSTLEGNLGL